VDGAPVEVTTRTEYPWHGRVEVTVTTAAPITVALRVPGWCSQFEVNINGTPVEAAPDHGYLRLRHDWTTGATITLDLAMPARIIAPHPRVDASRGCVALMRGPLVYCLEQTDLPADVVLEDVRIDPAAPIVPVTADRTDLPHIPVALTATGTVESSATPELYPTASAIDVRSKPVTLTAVPYFLWGNRSAGPMRVWIPTSSTQAPSTP
jgi:DUF1680 family protein